MWPYAAEITPEETKAAVYLGAVEAALAGTTSVLDHHYGRTDYDTTLAVASAVEEVGVRGVVARGMAGGYTALAKRQGLPERAFPLTEQRRNWIVTEACIKARPPGSQGGRMARSDKHRLHRPEPSGIRGPLGDGLTGRVGIPI